MPVTAAENEKYGAFVRAKAQEFGCFEFKQDDIVWHYTDGSGFLGILQSATLYATQVACLNDKSETKYATDLFNASINQLIAEKADDATATAFLTKVLEFVKDDPTTPFHGTSKFFVTCFSGDEDDLSQWERYGKKGYSIGFYAGGLCREPNSTLYKVGYDRERQEKTSGELARATLDFFMEGLTGDRIDHPEQWAEDFYAAWDDWIYKLAPLAKDPKWKAENEFRVVHELKMSEFGQVQFKQKETMLARFIALGTPAWVKRKTPLLPIAKIMIGPGNHPAFTTVSVKLLLEQLGYSNVPVDVSKIPLQVP